MLELVITGGQSGADLAGWRAAKACGIACSGRMPSDFLTEDGPRPEYAWLYGATELPAADYPSRTRANVDLADAVLIFCCGLAGYRSPGTRLTMRIAMELGRTYQVQNTEIFPFNPEQTADWLRRGVGTLMVAGNRESKAPGIGAKVEAYLTKIFGLLSEGQP